MLLEPATGFGFVNEEEIYKWFSNEIITSWNYIKAQQIANSTLFATVANRV